ncbi:MAG: hypothetical protein ABI629_02895 [bacterium]
MRLLLQLAGFALLLFGTRFLLRGHLVQQMDQECHIGGIALDVLAHGVRFPLLAYSPNEYDNGSFFSGLLAALSFSLFGPSVLALKLVTHLIAAAGAVAALSLLRTCLDERGITDRRVRWIAAAVLVIAIALAPRVVTLFSTYAVGNHAEGSAIDTILLALFARRLHSRSVPRTAAFWALVGFSLYLNKGTVLVIPVLAAVEVWLAAAAPARLLAGLAGFAVGVSPELLVIAQQHRAGREVMGWATVASKGERNAQAFPRAFLDTLSFLGEYRFALLASWAVAVVSGVALLVQRLARAGSRELRDHPPVAQALVVGVTLLHLAALTFMAKTGLDAYVIYGYPTLVVLFALLIASLCRVVAAAWGDHAGLAVGVACVALSLFLYRPDAMAFSTAKAAALSQNHSGAACSWRFAEGFEREFDYHLAALGGTREQHAIARCRSLTTPDQQLDCIGGIARELYWRQKGHVDGAPPAELDATEQRAYAYLYGTHRKGDATACGDFTNPDLTADCLAAVQMECLVFADFYTRIASGQGLGPPRCALPVPPMTGYWSAMRAELLARRSGGGPNLTRAWGDDNLHSCNAVFDACY